VARNKKLHWFPNESSRVSELDVPEERTPNRTAFLKGTGKNLGEGDRDAIVISPLCTMPGGGVPSFVSFVSVVPASPPFEVESALHPASARDTKATKVIRMRAGYAGDADDVTTSVRADSERRRA
jgi:hypothetical protein